MKTNILSLSFRKVECPKSAFILVGELRVDGELLGDKYALDVRQLAAALLREGEYFVFTCGCGVPDCAGIHEGISSRISGDGLILAGSLPKGGAFNFVFSVSQARKAVSEALASVKPLVEESARHEEGEEMVLGFGHSAYGFGDCIDSLRA